MKETAAPPTPVKDLVKPTTTAVARPSKFVPKKRLTLDVTNIQKLGELLCQTTSELYLQSMPSKFSETGKADAMCIDVIDLLRGEEFVLVCNAILARSFQRAEGPLVGRYFAIQCGEVVAGKSYRKVDVVELQRTE